MTNASSVDEGSRYYAFFIQLLLLFTGIGSLLFPFSFIPLVPVGMFMLMWLLRNNDPFIQKHGKSAFFVFLVWLLLIPSVLFGILGVVIWIWLGESMSEGYFQSLTSGEFHPTIVYFAMVDLSENQINSFPSWLFYIGGFISAVVPIVLPLVNSVRALLGKEPE